jgi:DNA-directed RNA polymerase specialized sigma24 family protein
MLRTQSAQRKFAIVRTDSDALAGFAEPLEIVSFLADPAASLDAKDRVLGALVLAAQTSAAPDVAHALLLLGLSPALERIQRTCAGRGAREEDETFAALVSIFLVAVSRLDLRGVTRVASTLVQNTERMFRYASRREHERRAKDDLLGAWDDGSAWSFADAAGPSATAAESRLLLSEVLAVAAADALLLLEVLACGESHADVAARLGLSVSATSKRYERTLASVRARLASSPTALASKENLK